MLRTLYRPVRELRLDNSLSSRSGLSQCSSLGGSGQLGDSRRQCLIPNLGRRDGACMVGLGLVQSSANNSIFQIILGHTLSIVSVDTQVETTVVGCT